jgi:hypothetical protein
MTSFVTGEGVDALDEVAVEGGVCRVGGDAVVVAVLA